MSEIAARIGEGISRWFRKPSPPGNEPSRGPVDGQEADTGRQRTLQHADTDIASQAVRARSGGRPHRGPPAPQSRVTDAPGQACVQSDHVDFAEYDILSHPRKRHCGSNLRNDEVQQRITMPSGDPMNSAPSRGVHAVQRAPMPEPHSFGVQPKVSVATQVTPQLHARTLSHLRPVLQQQGTAPEPRSPKSRAAVPPRSSLHDKTNGIFVTPGFSARAGVPQPHNSSLVRTSAPAGGLGKKDSANHRRQDAAGFYSARLTAPSAGQAKQWDHHLQTYHVLDATWAEKQAKIEVLDWERRQQLEARRGRTASAGPQPQASTLSKALDLVQQLKWDEMEQESKKAVREVELAASLAQLRVASDRRQVAVQSVPRPEPSWAAKSASVISEEQVEEEEGVVDLLSSSEDEEIATDQAPPAADADGVVDLLSSDEESAGSEDGEAGTELSDASMSDEELRIDGTDRILTQPLRAEYRRLTTDIHGHEPFVTHPRARIGITGEDMKLCGPGKWVGDACINMYMALLQDRDQEWCSNPDSRCPRTLFMNSHFLAKLCQEAAGYQYANVARWTRASKIKSSKIAYSGIKDLDKVVVPVHLGNHWTCAVLNFRDCQLEYYDSLLGVDQVTIQSLLRWVEDECADKYGGDVPDTYKARNWAEVFNPDSTPQQMNGFDCGIFCMMCCNYAGADKVFDYGQAEVHSFFRAMIAIECGHMTLRTLDD